MTTREPAFRLIILYKVVKSSVSLVFATTLVVLILAGQARHIQEGAASIARHMTRAWMLTLARLLEDVTQPSRLWLAAGALSLDGVMTGVEGWALSRGHRWGEWLVVVTTGVFLPFEVEAIYRGLHPWRILAFILNLAIVIYLARRIVRQRRRERENPRVQA